MTTPALTATSAGFTAVRVYTANDPYFYTIDNRPLGDLETNTGTLGSAADAGRRAALIDALFRAVQNETSMGTTRYIEGFVVSAPGANTARVGVGSVYEYGALTTGDARNIMKQAISPTFKDFTINTVSLGGGQSVIYAIEARFTDFSASTSGTFPLYDNTNTSLHAAMLFGDLQLQIVPGVAATAGSEAAPATTSGWFQLLWITVNVATPTTYSNVKYPTSATFNTWGLASRFLTLTNITSTSSTVGDNPTTHFADGSTQAAFSSIPLVTNGLVPVFNPYKPVKFKVTYSPSVTANAVAFQVKYQFIGSGDAATASYTTLTQDNITVAVSADQLATYTTVNGIVPGFGSVSKDRLNVVFQRIGADGADTNTGILRVLSIQAFQ